MGEGIGRLNRGAREAPVEGAERAASTVSSEAKKRLNVEEAVFIMVSTVQVPCYCLKASV
jgi:hypothetical protein